MKFELSKEYIKHIQSLIDEQSVIKLTEELNEIHAADIAEIYELIEIEQAHFLHNIIKEEKGAEILIELEDDLRDQLLDNLSPKEIAEEVLENLESDDAADIVSELPQEVKEEVLSHIEDVEHASDIADLLNYPEDTAGGLMAKELIKVNKNWTVMRCVREMRKQAENVSFVYTIYVVDDNDILLGTLSLKKLLLTDAKTIISEIYKEDIIMINANEDNEEVGNIMNKYDLIVLPVVNDLGQLIGRITVDDVMEVIKEELKKTTKWLQEFPKM